MPELYPIYFTRFRLAVIGRSTCPFCIEVTRTLGELGVPFAYLKVDAMAHGADLIWLIFCLPMRFAKESPFRYLIKAK